MIWYAYGGHRGTWDVLEWKEKLVPDWFVNLMCCALLLNRENKRREERNETRGTMRL